MPIQVGSTFAGYTIRQLLGVGGMGVVYLASHPRLDRLDALKILPATLTDDEEYRARFIREADLAASLWHPHIVGIHDRGEFDNHLWISMDYVAGTDAAKMLEQSSDGLPLADVIDIVTAIAEALDFAHQQRLLHRDVKPHNILVTDTQSRRQRILLADFGIARRDDEVSGLTATNMTLGTVDYAAPEQLMGESLDGRADQYALAATAYNLLTRTKLFEHSNPAVVISKHLNSPPPELSGLRPELRPLDSVFTRALAKSPHHRYETCLQFSEALRSGAASSPTVAAEVNILARPANENRHGFNSAPTQRGPIYRPQSTLQQSVLANADRLSESRAHAGASLTDRTWLPYTIVGIGIAIALATVGLTISITNRSSVSDDETPPAATAPSSSQAMESDTPRTEASPTTTFPTTTRPPTPTATYAPPNLTIAQYIQYNGITEAQVKRGDPGSPTVHLPTPPGWVDAGPSTPEWAYSQLVYSDPAMAPPPPTITAILSKLTGDVDGAKILEYAPNELKNLPGYSGKDAELGKFGGYDAMQVGGSYIQNGRTLLVAQKTTIIPTDDGLFVLQINAEGTEEQMGPLMDATAAIDEETTITP